jgi:hypothetical protein
VTTSAPSSTGVVTQQGSVQAPASASFRVCKVRDKVPCKAVLQGHDDALQDPLTTLLAAFICHTPVV